MFAYCMAEDRALGRILKLPVIFERAPVIENAVWETQLELALAREPHGVGSRGPLKGP